LKDWLTINEREQSVRQLHLMLDSDIRDRDFHDALLEARNPIAAP
jgi:hypothetical protein